MKRKIYFVKTFIDAQKLILSFMFKDGEEREINANDLKAEFGWSLDFIYNRISEFLEEGLIEPLRREKHGRFFKISNFGKDYLNEILKEKEEMVKARCRI